MVEAIRVLLVDDHELAREGLRRLLDMEPDIQLVGEASDGQEVVSKVESLSPDVILMDVKMPTVSGIEVTRLIKRSGMGGKVIVLSFIDEYLAQAIEAGADGYLTKDVRRDELVKAIRRVHQGDLVLGMNLMSNPEVGEHLVRRLQEIAWPNVTDGDALAPGGDGVGGIGDSLGVPSRNLWEQLQRSNEELEQARDTALEASQAKSCFLASMSHEIRTPMNAVLGMAELLSETPLTEEQQEYVRVFRGAGENLLDIINGILDLSKVESGQFELDEVGFDLEELVEDNVSFLAVRAHAKGLELNFRMAPDVPNALVGDPVRLRQVLTNLVGNAIKFTEQGEVTVQVEIDPEADEAGALRFRVSDTGIGIPPNKLEVIFKSFVQSDSSITREYGGTGLGLTISRRLIELMGGRIWVESELGEGSTFYFTARFGIRVEADKGIIGARNDLQGLKILVVDHNSTHRTIVRELLTLWGASASEAGNWDEAKGKLDTARKKGEPCQLLLLDGGMPGIDGLQVAEQLKNDPDLVGMTIMMLPSATRGDDIAQVQEFGISYCLIKPLKRAELYSAVAAALDRSKGAPQEQTSVGRSSESNARALRILLVEDSPDIQMLVQAYLKKTPHNIATAENGEIALQMFIEEDYDLVLMDMQMPVMDGYAATKAIRKWQREQGVSPSPIIALTAYALKEEVQRSLDAGCNAHISKPLRKERLLSAIREYASW